MEYFKFYHNKSYNQVIDMTKEPPTDSLSFAPTVNSATTTAASANTQNTPKNLIKKSSKNIAKTMPTAKFFSDIKNSKKLLREYGSTTKRDLAKGGIYLRRSLRAAMLK